MDLKQRQQVQMKDVQKFLENHLSNRAYIQDMLDQIVNLLHMKGKIFSQENDSFSWVQFYLYVSALTVNADTCNRSSTAIAGALELLILATDIVDEIVDNDNDLLKTMTLAEAITISNVLLMESFQMILENSSSNQYPQLGSTFKHLKSACNGQWEDLKLVVSESIPSEEDYFDIVQLKSASLIQLVCSLAYPANPQRLQRVATNIGIAGQLKNDAYDIFTDTKTDLIYKKATLPVIKALEFSIEEDNGSLLEMFHNLTNENAKLKNEIREYILKTGAKDYCLILSKLYIKKAIDELYSIFPNKQS